MEWTTEASRTSENSGLYSKCSGKLSEGPDATVPCSRDGRLKESRSKQEDERHRCGPSKTCGSDQGGSSEAGEKLWGLGIF